MNDLLSEPVMQADLWTEAAVSQSALIRQSDDTLADQIALWAVVQYSVVAFEQLVRLFGSVAAALAAPESAWRDAGVHASHLQRFQEWASQGALFSRVQHSVRQIEGGFYHLLEKGKPGYPRWLETIADAPPLLWVQGTTECLLSAQVALVGSRKPTAAGRQHAQEFAAALAGQGFCISSGLAQGIDAAAHQGALSVAGGRTLAVVGTGLDHCYPVQHRGLLEKIVQSGGAIVSEFLPDTAPLAHHFPRRNRLISGLSLGVVVVEAALKSGSLITARQAAEQGRDVFAIPSHIHNSQAEGCLHLIREGATLVYDPVQIIASLDLPKRWQAADVPVHQVLPAENSASEQAFPLLPPLPILSETAQNEPTPHPVAAVTQAVPASLQRLWQSLDWEGQSMDQLVERLAMPVPEVAAQLMELELLGLVMTRGGLYHLCRA